MLRTASAYTFVVLLLGITACSADRAPEPTASSDSLRNRNAGVLILGLGATRIEQPGTSSFKQPLAGMWLSYTRVDAAKATAHFVLPSATIRASCAGFWAGKPGCTLAQTQYLALELPASDYTLSRFNAFWGMTDYQTRILKPFPFAFLPEVPVDLDRIIRWQVRPGEVIYGGDLIFDPVAFPAKLVRYERNDGKARASLSGSPQLRDAMVFRAPLRGRAAAGSGDVEKLIEGDAGGAEK